MVRHLIVCACVYTSSSPLSGPQLLFWLLVKTGFWMDRKRFRDLAREKTSSTLGVKYWHWEPLVCTVGA